MARITSNSTAADARRVRQQDLRAMLLARERDILDTFQRRVSQVPSGRNGDGLDESEHAEAGIQEHIEVALIQMEGSTLQRVRESLVRLAAGEFGNCAECDCEISEKRLRALPFAVRCTACETLHEQSVASARRFDAPPRASSLYFAGLAGS
jgi:DnaK suppressor protein